MKKILHVLLLVVITLSLNAQTNVYLKMNHFLGNNAFAFNTSATNNLGNTFNVKRLQYYVAEIKLVHDGGQITDVTDKWILVNANTSVNELLGSFNITSIEAIKFGIGVQQSYNHLDPSSYPMSHPLAPKSPSMHWGWASGYRFIAMEGKTGPTLDQVYEFHALGDANYHVFTIPTSGALVGSNLEVTINADYERAFYNVNLNTVPYIIHGEVGKAAELLVNFSNNVFTSSDGNNSIGLEENGEKAELIKFYPNPSTSKISIQGIDKNQSVVVYDMHGALVVEKHITSSEDQNIILNRSGIYLMVVLEGGDVVKSEKIVITN